MAIFLSLCWATLAIYGGALFGAYILKSRSLSKLKEMGAPFALVSISFLIIGIVTNDPLFAPLGVQPEYEWLAGLLSSFYLLYQTYLKPLKERVIRTETDVSAIKADVRSLKTD